MTTLYVSHPASFDHVVPEGHPERPARMRAIERALEDERFATLVRVQAPRAEPSVATLAHPAEYVDALMAAVPSRAWSASIPTRSSPRQHGGGPAGDRRRGPCRGRA